MAEERSNVNNESDVDEVRIPLKAISDDNHNERKVFDQIDKNGDGLISKQEFTNFFQKTFTPEELNKIFQNGDVDKDGHINYKEFLKIFLKLCGRKYLNFIVAPVVKKKPVYYDEEEEEENSEELYTVQWSCKPPKLGMLTISIIEIVFFIIDEYIEDKPLKQIFKYNSCRRFEIWRFFTYTFIHSGKLHLIANLTVQLFFGIPLELYHGWWRILFIYCSGVITGSLFTSLMDPKQNLVGASGGVYALITAHIANIIINWSQLKRGTYPGLQLFILLLISSTDLGTSIYERYVSKVDLHVGYAAHFAGAVAGLLVGISILRNIKIMQHERVIWWLAAILYIILMKAAVLWNVFYPGHHFYNYCQKKLE